MKSISSDKETVKPNRGELYNLFLNLLKQGNSGKKKVLDDKREIGPSASDFIPMLAVIKYLLNDNGIKLETKEELFEVLTFMSLMYKSIYSGNKESIYGDKILNDEKVLADAEKNGKIELYVANDQYLVNMLRRNLYLYTERELAEKINILKTDSVKTMIQTYLNKLRKFEQNSENIHEFRNKVIMDNIDTALDKETQINNVIEFLRSETKQCEDLICKTKEIDKQMEKHNYSKEKQDEILESVKKVSKDLDGFKLGGVDYTKIINSNKELIKELEAMLLEQIKKNAKHKFNIRMEQLKKERLEQVVEEMKCEFNTQMKQLKTKMENSSLSCDSFFQDDYITKVFQEHLTEVLQEHKKAFDKYLVAHGNKYLEGKRTLEQTKKDISNQIEYYLSKLESDVRRRPGPAKNILTVFETFATFSTFAKKKKQALQKYNYDQKKATREAMQENVIAPLQGEISKIIKDDCSQKCGFYRQSNDSSFNNKVAEILQKLNKKDGKKSEIEEDDKKIEDKKEVNEPTDVEETKQKIVSLTESIEMSKPLNKKEDKKSEIEEDDKKIEDKKEVNKDKDKEIKKTENNPENKKKEENKKPKQMNNDNVSDDFLMRMMRKKRGGKGF